MSTFECGVCWNVYDPAVGDDVAQVPAGTAFADLPEGWRCPTCDSPKERYLQVPEEQTPVDPRIDRLVAEYRLIADVRMKGLPIVNPRLHVEAVGFQATAVGLVGALVTPWSINAVLFPLSGEAPVNGHQRALPGGSYRFLPQRLEGVGYVELCSLFSPVFQFEGQAEAVAAAQAALAPMVTAPVPVEPHRPEAGAPTSRRELLSRFRRGES